MAVVTVLDVSTQTRVIISNEGLQKRGCSHALLWRWCAGALLHIDSACVMPEASETSAWCVLGSVSNNFITCTT